MVRSDVMSAASQYAAYVEPDCVATCHGESPHFTENAVCTFAIVNVIDVVVDFCVFASVPDVRMLVDIPFTQVMSVQAGIEDPLPSFTTRFA